jgi:uncharacterized membrane protein YiaA
MAWIILFVGVLILVIGMYATSDMHNQLEKQGHHWSSALEIGSRAGNILGFGLGLIMAAMLFLLNSMI